MSLAGDRLIDPLMPTLGGLVVFMASSISTYAVGEPARKRASGAVSSSIWPPRS